MPLMLFARTNDTASSSKAHSKTLFRAQRNTTKEIKLDYVSVVPEKDTQETLNKLRTSSTEENTSEQVGKYTFSMFED